jgi:toxin YhaV
MLDRVPRDPLAAEFRPGNTLGPAHRHWFGAKFGTNRFRLSLRADAASRTVMYAWVNDRDTLRKAGAASDPYSVFAGMLAHGNPPDDWPRLLAAAQDPAAMRRFAAVAPKP